MSVLELAWFASK